MSSCLVSEQDKVIEYLLIEKNDETEMTATHVFALLLLVLSV